MDARPDPDAATRVAALAEYGILHTAPEEPFDRIARIAARELGMPIGLITMLDAERQWCKAHWGLDLTQTRLAQAFCRHAIRQDGLMEVDDAQHDPRFADNPLVTGPPHIRFYAGAPLVTPEGVRLGTLCVIDTLPHAGLPDSARETLQDLSRLVMDRLELRRQLRAHAALLEQTRLVAQLTTLAAEAPNFAAAIRGTCDMLLAATGARSCLVLRMHESGSQLRMIHGTDIGRQSPNSFAARMRPLAIDPETSLSACAMHSGLQLWTRTGHDDGRNDAARQLAREAGIDVTLFTPFRLLDQHYVFSLGFDDSVADRQQVAGAMQGAVAALRPLLRRLLDEERLTLFQRAVEASTDAVIITEAEPLDAPGPVIVYTNPANERTTGYALADVLGRSQRMFQGPQTDPAARATIRAALAQWQPVRQTLRNYRKDGTPIWIELNISPVVDADGWCTNWVSVQRDLTEERALAEEAEATRRDLAALINAIPGVLMRHRPRTDTK